MKNIGFDTPLLAASHKLQSERTGVCLWKMDIKIPDQIRHSPFAVNKSSKFDIIAACYLLYYVPLVF
jgi:hypothetical protein